MTFETLNLLLGCCQQVIPTVFLQVTLVTKELEIREGILSSFLYGYDMIKLQVPSRTTPFTLGMEVFQNQVSR